MNNYRIHHLRGITRRIGIGFENGKDTFELAKIVGLPEALVERHLHEYLFWRRADNPAQYGAILETGELNAYENEDQTH